MVGAAICLIFLLGIIPCSVPAPEPLDRLNVNLFLDEGANKGHSSDYDEFGDYDYLRSYGRKKKTDGNGNHGQKTKTDGSGNGNQGDYFCYRDNAIFNGHPIVIDGENNIQPTAQDCSLSCCQTVRCSLWTYHKSSKRCWLKGYMKRTDFISGRKNCPLPSSMTGINDWNSNDNLLIEACVGLNARGYCYKDNTIWGGDTTFQVNIQPTPHDCQRSCSNTFGCILWNYMKSTNRCFFKRPTRGNGFISGQKNCLLDSSVNGF